MDPARGAARFHDDQIKLVVLEDGSEIIAVRGGGHELVFSGFGIKKAAHGIELAEVEGENFQSDCPLAKFHGKEVGGTNVTVFVVSVTTQSDPRSRA